MREDNKQQIHLFEYKADGTGLTFLQIKTIPNTILAPPPANAIHKELEIPKKDLKVLELIENIFNNFNKLHKEVTSSQDKKKSFKKMKSGEKAFILLDQTKEKLENFTDSDFKAEQIALLGENYKIAKISHAAILVDCQVATGDGVEFYLKHHPEKSKKIAEDIIGYLKPRKELFESLSQEIKGKIGSSYIASIYSYLRDAYQVTNNQLEAHAIGRRIEKLIDSGNIDLCDQINMELRRANYMRIYKKDFPRALDILNNILKQNNYFTHKKLLKNDDPEKDIKTFKYLAFANEIKSCFLSLNLGEEINNKAQLTTLRDMSGKIINKKRESLSNRDKKTIFTKLENIIDNLKLNLDDFKTLFDAVEVAKKKEDEKSVAIVKNCGVLKDVIYKCAIYLVTAYLNSKKLQGLKINKEEKIYISIQQVDMMDMIQNFSKFTEHFENPKYSIEHKDVENNILRPFTDDAGLKLPKNTDNSVKIMEKASVKIKKKINKKIKDNQLEEKIKAQEAERKQKLFEEEQKEIEEYWQNFQKELETEYGARKQDLADREEKVTEENLKEINNLTKTKKKTIEKKENIEAKAIQEEDKYYKGFNLFSAAIDLSSKPLFDKNKENTYNLFEKSSSSYWEAFNLAKQKQNHVIASASLLALAELYSYQAHYIYKNDACNMTTCEQIPLTNMHDPIAINKTLGLYDESLKAAKAAIKYINSIEKKENCLFEIQSSAKKVIEERGKHLITIEGSINRSLEIEEERWKRKKKFLDQSRSHNKAERKSNLTYRRRNLQDALDRFRHLNNNVTGNIIKAAKKLGGDKNCVNNLLDQTDFRDYTLPAPDHILEDFITSPVYEQLLEARGPQH